MVFPFARQVSEPGHGPRTVPVELVELKTERFAMASRVARRVRLLTIEVCIKLTTRN